MSTALLLVLTVVAQGGRGGAAAPDRQVPEWAKPGRCGTNSLYVMLRTLTEARWIESEISYEEVARQLPPDNDRGVSLAAIAEASQRLGVPAVVRKVAVDDLAWLRTPFIAHLDLLDQGGTGHYITVYDVQKANGRRYLHYIDGSTGQMSNDDVEDIKEVASGFVLIPGSSRGRDARWWPFAAGAAGLGIALAVEGTLMRTRRSGVIKT